MSTCVTVPRKYRNIYNNIFCVTKHTTVKRNKITVHKSAREYSQPISISQSVSCNFTLSNTDDHQTQHNLFSSAAIQYTIDTNTELAHNRTLNLTRTIRNVKITNQATREAAEHTTLCLHAPALRRTSIPQLGRRPVCRPTAETSI